MRCALALLTALTGAPAAAQVPFPAPDVVSELRLQNEQRWLETEQRGLEADVARLRTDQTLNRLERQRLPDPALVQRQALADSAEAQTALRAQQAQSAARAARLRSGLAAFGFADGLPLSPR